MSKQKLVGGMAGGKALPDYPPREPMGGAGILIPVYCCRVYNEAWESDEIAVQYFTTIEECIRFLERWDEYRSGFLQGIEDYKQGALSEVHTIEVTIDLMTVGQWEKAIEGQIGGRS